MKRNRLSLRIIPAVFLCAVLTVSLGFMASAGADQSVAYIERSWSGSAVTSTQKVCSSYTKLSSNYNDKVSLGDSWYVLSSDVVYSKCLQITGNAKIILCDGKTLTASDGIYIQQGKTLTIYAQQGGTGAINAVPDSGPGIGGVADTVGGNLTIHGGKITAQGETNAAGIGGGNHKSGMGDIVIYDGTIKATGGSSGAGIGRGQQNNTLGSLTIYGGTIEARGGNYAAGIGGGEDRSGYKDLKIYGGDITAIGGYSGAGIGGGEGGDGSDSGGEVWIYGGTVHAAGGSNAAGIGGGKGGKDIDTVHIWGGKVKAYAGVELGSDNNDQCAIGWGRDGDITHLVDLAGDLRVKAGDKIADMTWQNASDRTLACLQYYDVYIEPCTDHEINCWAVNPDQHKRSCQYCNFSETKNHEFDEVTKTCAICGYETTHLKVSFLPGEGTGTMSDRYVKRSEEYALPGSSFTAPAKKAFDKWSVVIGNDAAILRNQGETITVTQIVTATALWKNVYDLTVNKPADGGTVSADRTRWYENDAGTITLTVKPQTGWKLTSISAVNGSNEEITLTQSTSDSNKYTFETPAADVTVSATFEKIVYNVSVDTITHGTVTANHVTANYRDEVTLTVTPESGYTLTRLWVTYGDNDERTMELGTGNSTTTFQMPTSDVTAHATFVLKVAYDYDSDYGTLSGTTSVNNAGETITVTATPKENCGLRSLYYTMDTTNARVVLDILEIGGAYQITMPPSGITVHAQFERKYTITCAEAEHGTITVNKEKAYAGETITVIYTPSGNYWLTDYDVHIESDIPPYWGTITPENGGEGTARRFTFIMPSYDVTVLGTFTDFSETNTITIDFCAGHETLAQSFNGLKSIPTSQEACTVSGTLVTIPVVVHSDSAQSLRVQAQDYALGFIRDRLSGNNYIDAGEQLVELILGSKPLKDYESEEELKQESFESGKYCLLWKTALKDPVTVTIEPLTNGTEIKKVCGASSATNHTDPQPVVTVTGPVTSDTSTTSWYVSYDAGSDQLGNMAGEQRIITVQGGDCFYTRIYLTPDFRHYIAAPSQIISVNNDVVKQAWYHSDNSGSANVVAKIQVSDKTDAGVCITGGDKAVTWGDTGIVLVATAEYPGDNGTWTWTSKDTGIAEIDSATGEVTIHSTGETIITVKYKSDTTIGKANIILLVVPKTVFVPVAVEGLIYTGEAQAGVLPGDGYTLTGDTATDAGDYTATAALWDNYSWDDGTTEDKTIAWSISKTSNPAKVTPTAFVAKGENKVDLSDNVLLNGASGTVSYEISGDANGCTLSGSVLTSGSDKGSVIVNVVVAEDNNYYALAETPITVTIGDKTVVAIGHEDKEVTYSADGIIIPVDGMFTIPDGAGAAAYSVTNGTGDGSFADNRLTVTRCGTFTVTVNTAATATHTAGVASATLTVNKANAVPAVVIANNRTCDGTEQPLVTVTGTAIGGGMKYALGTETGATEPYLTSVPTKADAGTYYVWYKVVGDANHFDSKADYVTVTIAEKPVVTVYSYIEGDGAEWTKGAETDLDFTITGSPEDAGIFDRFTGLASDGIAVAAGNYTATSGSVKLTLKAEWLETLAAGKHILTANFTDGTAEASFTVKDAVPTETLTEEPTAEPTATPTTTPTLTPVPTDTPAPTATPTATPKPKPVPKTGDSTPLALWMGLILIGMICLGAFAVQWRRMMKKR